jgi:hypothetical protein
MARLDDEAVLVFAAARDNGLSIAEASDLADTDMDERGVKPSLAAE